MNACINSQNSARFCESREGFFCKLKSVVYNNLILSNFSFCPLFWYFSGITSNQKLYIYCRRCDCKYFIVKIFHNFLPFLQGEQRAWVNVYNKECFSFVANEQKWWPWHVFLTHWGRVTHICVSRITNIGSDNGLSPGRRQAIIWTNVGILLIRTLGTNFSEILSAIHTFSFKKMH